MLSFFVGVIDIWGFTGGLREDRAALLAANGFAVLAFKRTVHSKTFLKGMACFMYPILRAQLTGLPHNRRWSWSGWPV